MAQMYYSKLTGALTNQQYDSDRYGNLILNRTASIGAVAAAQGTQANYNEYVRSGSPQQLREARNEVASMSGRGLSSSVSAQNAPADQYGREIGPERPGDPSTYLRGSSGPRSDYGREIGPERPGDPSTYLPGSIGPDANQYGANYSRNRNSSAGAVPDVTRYNPVDPLTGVVKNYYIPEGSYRQQELQNIKLGKSESGELAFFEQLGFNEAGQRRMVQNPDTGTLDSFMLIGGGGRNAAQSGMFGYAAGTPAVFGRGRVQEGTAGLITPEVMAPSLRGSSITGEEISRIVEGGNAGGYDISDYLSKLGAEAYGQTVGFIDNRTLGNVTYEDVTNRAPWNEARYADPLAVNRGKADLPGAAIPWSVGADTPAIFGMDKTGIVQGKPGWYQEVGSFDAYMPKLGGVDVSGMGTRSAAPNITLTGRDISYGDIAPVAAAEGLGRLRGSKTVAGTPVIVAEGAHATELNSYKKTCGKVDQAFQQQTGTPAAVSSSSGMGGLTLFMSPDIAVGKSPSEAVSKLPKSARASFSTASLGSEFRLTPGAWPFVSPENMREDVGRVASVAAKGDVWKTWEGFNQLVTKNTPLALFPDLSAAHPDTVSKAASIASAPATGGLSLLPQYQENNLFVGSVVQGAYEDFRTKPIENVALFGAGRLYSEVRAGIPAVVGIAAKSGVPGVATAGRALSTPLAADVGKVGELALGGYLVYEAGRNIIDQPTIEKKGQTLGSTAVQFAAFGMGASVPSSRVVDNPYAGRGFFSGQLKQGPVEAAQFKAETYTRSLFTQDPAAYREVSRIATAGRFIEPTVKAEPKFGELTTSGDYAAPIKATLTEQPHSVIGSASVRQQYPQSIVESSGLRIGKDVDVLLESPSRAITSLSGKTGLSEAGAKGVMDVHPIPKGYPGFKASIEAETAAAETSPLSLAFGDPYRNVAFPRGSSEIVKPGAGYSGQLTYESAQVQFGRKAAGTAVAIESPMLKGYRAEKDIYDFVSLYQAQRATAIGSGVSPKAFAASDKDMASFMGRSFTFDTIKGGGKPVTRSVSDIMAEGRRTAGTRPSGQGKVRVVSETPSRGIVSPLFVSAIPSVASALTSPSVVSSRPSYLKTSPLESYPSITGGKSPSSPSAPSGTSSLFASGSPAKTMGSPFSVPSRTPISMPGSPSGSPSPYRYPSPSSTPSPYPSPSPSPSPYTPPSPTYRPPPYSPPGSPSLVPPISPFDGGGSGSSFFKPRKAAFMETFNMGLDIGGAGGKRIMSPAKSFGPARRAPPRRKAPVVRKLKPKRK